MMTIPRSLLSRLAWVSLLWRLATQILSAAHSRVVEALRPKTPTPPVMDASTAQLPTQPAPPAHALHVHTPRPHVVRNANHVQQQERAQAGFNTRLAVFLTTYVGTMYTAYGFAALAVVGLFGVLAILNPSIYTLIAWLSQTFIQLVLLPVIMVGQNVLNHHAELQADEMYHGVMNTLHDAEQTTQHLTAQDAELLKQTTELLKQTPMLQQLLAEMQALASASGVPLPPSTPVTIPPAATPSMPTDSRRTAQRHRRRTGAGTSRWADPADPPLQES